MTKLQKRGMLCVVFSATICLLTYILSLAGLDVQLMFLLLLAAATAGIFGIPTILFGGKG